jgi:hypothetical protein
MRAHILSPLYYETPSWNSRSCPICRQAIDTLRYEDGTVVQVVATAGPDLYEALDHIEGRRRTMVRTLLQPCVRVRVAEDSALRWCQQLRAIGG